jgi:predicted TIM-barrel fold metal-dependent hydrolase
MWGSDYPFIPYERYFDGLKQEGYSQEIIDKILFLNAQRLFANFGKEV